MPIREWGSTECSKKPGCEEIGLHGGGYKDLEKDSKERTALDKMVKVNQGERETGVSRKSFLS